MITFQELTVTCTRTLKDFEKSNGTRIECVAIMYEPDPACPTVAMFPIPLADIAANQDESDIISMLNPAEHTNAPELALSNDVTTKLPRGDELQKMLRNVVAQMRQDMPDKLIYMTDPECSELVDSVREARLPPSLSWLASLL